MITLLRATAIVRKILKWGGILVLSLIVLTLLFRVGINLRNKFFPPPPPPPTVVFGKLPALKFPKSTTSAKLSYSLETLTGLLPAFPSQVKVYETVRNQASLLALKRARERVAKLDFIAGETQISENVYRWTDPQQPDRMIKFDIISNDFDLTSDFYHNPEILAAENLPNPQNAQKIAKAFLTNLGLLPSDLEIENAKVGFFLIKEGALVPTTSLSNAQVTRIDFFQKALDDLAIVYPKKRASLINMLIGSTKDLDKQIVEAHFFYRPVNLTNSSTYPLKSAETAFEELGNNQAYIVSLDDPTKTNIEIKNVSLAYYSSRENENFLYPVFVFEGNNGFLAYVLAIDSSWIETPSQ